MILFEELKIGDKFKFDNGKQVWEKISTSHAKIVNDPAFELQIMDHANVIKENG